MPNAILIVQGEGKGHISQSIALKEYLEKAGHGIKAVFLGTHPGQSVPDYFRESFRERVHLFQSPFFVRTPNQKGIYLGRSFIVNILRIFTYLKEVQRIRRAIKEMDPDVVYNFYDLVGAMALKKIGPGIRRIGIGHHFLLHLENYRCDGPGGPDRWLLRLHTRLVMRSCDQVLALSYREIEGRKGIRVIPPLVRRSFREIHHEPGERYLAYLMAGGYLYDLVRMSQEDPDFKADVFSEIIPGMELPAGIRLYPPDENRFRELMSNCRGVITTAGFDTPAEAAFHGIPLMVIPARGHYEQSCNSMDVERSGIGIAVKHLSPGIQARMKASGAKSFRDWVNKAEELVLSSIQE